MAVVDLLTFRLLPGTDEALALAADARVQEEAYPPQSGFLRRTTTRRDGAPDDWLVIVLWASAEQAAGAEEAVARHPATQAFAALAEPGSFHRERYHTLN